MLDAHHNAIVAKRKSTLHEITAYAARWNEQAWRLMVVLHAGRYGKLAHEHTVDQQTAQAAITLTDWFAEHQMWVLQKSELATFTRLSRQIIALCRQQVDGVTATNLCRARIAPDAEAAHALLEKMHASGSLSRKELKPPGGGHRTKIYREEPI